MLPWWRISGLREVSRSYEVNTEHLALVLENLHFRYVSSPSEEESLENLENLQSVDSIEGIPISWVEAWETDLRTGALGEYIQRNSAEQYEELSQELEEERARVELNSVRRLRVLDWELEAEEKREELEERNAKFREEFEFELEFEDQTEWENEEGWTKSYELIGEEGEEDEEDLD